MIPNRLQFLVAALCLTRTALAPPFNLEIRATTSLNEAKRILRRASEFYWSRGLRDPDDGQRTGEFLDRVHSLPAELFPPQEAWELGQRTFEAAFVACTDPDELTQGPGHESDLDITPNQQEWLYRRSERLLLRAAGAMTPERAMGAMFDLSAAMPYSFAYSSDFFRRFLASRGEKSLEDHLAGVLAVALERAAVETVAHMARYGRNSLPRSQVMMRTTVLKLEPYLFRMVPFLVELPRGPAPRLSDEQLEPIRRSMEEISDRMARYESSHWKANYAWFAAWLDKKPLLARIKCWSAILFPFWSKTGD